MKIYGPYIRKDGRKHIIIINGNMRRTVSYPKFLMEQKLGWELAHNETIHHINGDFQDDSLENLKLIDRIEHSRHHRPTQCREVSCPECNKMYLQKYPSQKFCSYHCNSKYQRRAQLAGVAEWNTQRS